MEVVAHSVQRKRRVNGGSDSLGVLAEKLAVRMLKLKTSVVNLILGQTASLSAPLATLWCLGTIQISRMPRLVLCMDSQIMGTNSSGKKISLI